ncbi:NAD(P)/FAD-dependent oxidoreductase [Flagellimonas sp. S174]|uniref:NAD(P)/FAD-dependent oxidoreductase n=1 Tax=Flagellimonas sp. S174 TaxID=3410790 RepID=UPI003BF542F2
MFDVIVAGGGAAGFYAAIQIAEKNPNLKIAILERGKTVLSKVRISGGGRCNVTQAKFYAKELVDGYPRGQKELLGPFHSHAPEDVIAFFEERGVPLKIEEDGRIFPKSDSSQSIIDCFLKEIEKHGIQVLKNSSVKDFSRLESGHWQVTTMNKDYKARILLLATGSNARIWNMLQDMGHSIVSPVPSLFTFNINDERIKGIPGISVNASVEIPPKKIFASNISVELKSAPKQHPVLESEGPVLITHWGLSGPAILKLSAWGARILENYKYNFRAVVNWTPEYSTSSMEGYLKEVKEVEAKKTVFRTQAISIPKRLWMRLVAASGIAKELRWGEVTKEQLKNLSKQLTACSFKVEGKSTFKEEFVTAGGVDLKEINFKTFESKLFSNLFFAGEIIDVDGITGGYNFQNAWTGAYLAAQEIASRALTVTT